MRLANLWARCGVATPQLVGVGEHGLWKRRLETQGTQREISISGVVENTVLFMGQVGRELR